MKDEDSKTQIMLIDTSKDSNPFPHDTLEDNEIGLKTIDSGVGYNILKTMGWHDGLGLGKNSQGRTEPIQ